MKHWETLNESLHVLAMEAKQNFCIETLRFLWYNLVMCVWTMLCL